MSTKHELCDSLNLAPAAAKPCGFSDCEECDSTLAGYDPCDCQQMYEEAALTDGGTT